MLLFKWLYIDELTGLYNRRYMRKKFEKFKKNGCCVAIMDLNNFKRYNKISYTHGDTVLKIAAVDIKKYILKFKIDCPVYVGRWGGDEFIIILKSTNHYNAGLLYHIGRHTDATVSHVFCYKTDNINTIIDILNKNIQDVREYKVI